MVAKMSPLFPNEAINIKNHIEIFPKEGTVPELPEWKWIHTPGHTPGHISLFREKDRLLIAGDAFVTVRQDSLYKVLTQEIEITGPPRYLTPDWQASWNSIKTLAKLTPEIAVTGHGLPVAGNLLSTGLQKLAQDFDKIAIPNYGRFVEGVH